MQESDTTKLWQKAAKVAEPLMRKPLTVPEELLKNLKRQHPNSNLLKVAKSTGVLSNVLDENYHDEIGRVKLGESAVKHFSPKEIEKFKVSVNADGKLVDYKGDILECPADGKTPKYAFVMNTDGELYVFEKKVGDIHHSSILGGKPCLGGGHIVINNGEVTDINNATGHYKTGRLGLYVVAKILEAKFPKAVNFGKNHTHHEDEEGEDIYKSEGATSYMTAPPLKNLFYRMEHKDKKNQLTGFESEGNEMLQKYYATLPKPRTKSICEGIEEYAKNPNPALLRTIIKLNKDDINKTDEKTGKTPLEFAIHTKCPEEVSAMLLLNGAKTTENITKSSNRISDLINRYESLKQVRQFVGTTATSTSISQTSHSANKSAPRQF